MSEHGSPSSPEMKPFSFPQLRTDLEELFRRYEAVTLELDLVTRQKTLIQELDRAILRSTTSAEEVLSIIIDKGREYTDSQHGQAVLMQRNQLVVQVSSEPSFVGTILDPNGSLCGRAIRLGEDQHWPHVDEIPNGEYVRLHEDTNSEIAILIRPERSARVLGVLNLERQLKGPFSPGARSFAKLLAGQAAIAIEQARIAKSVDLLYQVSMDLLLGELQPGLAYDRILSGVLEALNFQHGQVLVAKNAQLVILASSRKEDIGLVVDATNSICGRWLLAEQQRGPLRLDDIADSPYATIYLPLLESEAAGAMRSEMIIPLIDRDVVIGALNIESPEPGAFSDHDEKLLGVAGSLLVRALSATFSRTNRVNRERVEASQLAMTQLGNVAQSFVHNFGSDVGYVRSNLLYLQDGFLKEMGHRNSPQDAEVERLIPDLVSRLTEASETLNDFQKRFNPSDPVFHPKVMDLVDVGEAAVAKFSSALKDDDTRVMFINKLPAAKTIGGVPILASCLCELSQPIYEVLENLLTNAEAAVAERRTRFPESFRIGFIQVEIDLPDPLYGRIRVTDNGIGIPPKHLAKIFEFGFSTKRATGGSRGIGLWFCELYMLQRGGSIKVNSREGYGTTFELLFPSNLGYEPAKPGGA